ncbi:hypothetical protein C7212DRAFT_71767, partial [Tuber magnatum]
YWMLILDSYESHVNTESNEYCQENNLVPSYLLAYSSYLTQLLDLGVFSALKKAYSTQISFLARTNITYIIKDNFFHIFWATFKATFIEQNIKSSFQGADLVLFDVEVV